MIKDGERSGKNYEEEEVRTMIIDGETIGKNGNKRRREMR